MESIIKHTEEWAQVGHKHTKCRVCGGALSPVMDFGSMPLANGLEETESRALNAPRYEQTLLICDSCKLGQLSFVVNPEILYKDYVYKSSVSGVFREHCAGLAESLNLYSYPEGAAIVDIAGNDGACMREVLRVMPDVRGFVVDVAQDDEPANYTKVKEFWSSKTVAEFVAANGKASAFIAQNVVGHVDDVQGFFRAVRSALTEDGVFVVEVPSFKAMIENHAFDTVYHEHLSYWSVTAMVALAGRCGFDVSNVVYFPAIHCGTLRFWLTPDSGFKHGANVSEHLAAEAAFFTGENLQDFEISAELDVARVMMMLNGISPYTSIIGVTASAKSNVFLNYAAEISAYRPAVHIEYLVEDAETKHGKFSPGVGIEIKPMMPETVSRADVAVILSRNLAGSLIARLRALGFKGLVLTL